MAQTHISHELCEFVESITDCEGVAIFLYEIAAYGHAENIIGLTRPQYRTARDSHRRHTYTHSDKTFVIDLSKHAKYKHLMSDKMASMLYAVGLMQITLAAVPDSKALRFELYKKMFNPDACYDRYMKG